MWSRLRSVASAIRKRVSRLSNENAPIDCIYLAALRATAPLAPMCAVALTVLAYLILGELSATLGDYAVFSGEFAVVFGLSVAILIWLAVAVFYRPHTAAVCASRRNYDLLREKLNRLRNGIKSARAEGYYPDEKVYDSCIRVMREQALAYASKECDEIERRLNGKGMPWVTGQGYIDLWHRVHRAAEALVKVEPYSEVLEGAMRDESRLVGSNIRNAKSLLRRLRRAAAILDDSETGKYLSYFEEYVECSLAKQSRARPENRAKALAILSEVRYEINHFRDSVWEGIVNARNRLAESSVLLGFAAYGLLATAIFADAPPDMVISVIIYFLIGAVIGFFAQAQAEWSTDTAVDDFGLSTARLLHIPWLSGLAAVGGVLITSVLDGQVASPTADMPTLAAIFDIRPVLLIAAAVFGLTPDLLIRRLTQQTDRYKEDLRSTQSSQSTTDVSINGSRQTRPVARTAP